MRSPAASRPAVAGARRILRSPIAPVAINPTSISSPTAAESVGLPRRLADELAVRTAISSPGPKPAVCSASFMRCRHAARRRYQLLRGTRPPGGRPHPGSVQRDRYCRTRRPLQTGSAALSACTERTRRGGGTCLFVAGSAYDLFGTARVGMPTWWHDRIGMTVAPDTPSPIAHHRTLTPLLTHALS